MDRSELEEIKVEEQVLNEDNDAALLKNDQLPPIQEHTNSNEQLDNDFKRYQVYLATASKVAEQELLDIQEKSTFYWHDCLGTKRQYPANFQDMKMEHRQIQKGTLPKHIQDQLTKHEKKMR